MGKKKHKLESLREDRPLDQQQMCNCRGGPQNCPVGGKCLIDCVVYEVSVTEVPSGKKETYTGVTSRSFKRPFYEHKADMSKSESRTKSSLSAHVWDLKGRGTNFEVSWRIKERSTAYNSTT